MNRYERLTTLLELLSGGGHVDVETLSRDLDVSSATVRRDLDHLAHQQLLTRTDLRGPEGAPAITVVTNALNIANELAIRPNVKIVVTGGVARPQSYELIGPLAVRILEDISLDIVFLGVDFVDPGAGATAHHEGEAAVNRVLVNHAQRVVVVADASKLGGRAFARICTADEIATIVTDASADAAVVARFRDLGVEVLLV